MGKIRAEGHGEVQEMIDICDFAVGLSRQLYGLTMASERPAHRMMEQWHPLGVVGVITAFNFPVAVWSWNTAIAAVCGDPVVWKPAGPDAALRHRRAAHRQPRDGRPRAQRASSRWSIGPGRSVGERMLNDPRLPLISFTGSTQVGRARGGGRRARFGRTILELGGNNAIIVTEDANLDLATRAILFGAVGTAGQRCTSTRRIIVHKRDREGADRPPGARLRAGARSAIRSTRQTLMGPLVTPDARRRHVAGDRRRRRPQGGEVLCGGRTRVRTSGRSSSSRPSSACRRRPRS